VSHDPGSEAAAAMRCVSVTGLGVGFGDGSGSSP
jgi:hypothetical protein